MYVSDLINTNKFWKNHYNACFCLKANKTGSGLDWQGGRKDVGVGG